MIRILDKHVSDKIAAGEVVERPLSVIKELLENSVDAGATSVTVEIKNGGKSYMRVTDNGCGIASCEVVTAFERHATSKIEKDSDLLTIETLGFRGEALASIAAVSRVEMLTKTADSKTGRKVSIAGGTLLENSETGCPDGTTIVVSDLFFNTPARLKFMKSDRAESAAVIEFVSEMALAYPNIRIRVINNDSILFATNGKGDVKANISTIYSREISDSLVPVSYSEDSASVCGFVSSPGASWTNKRNQIYFVNGRRVNSKLLENAVSEAYHDRLFDGRFPACYIFLRTDPSKLDVNIHPNKREVKFDDNLFIAGLVTRGIREALSVKEAVPEIKDKSMFRMREKPDASKNTMPAAISAGPEITVSRPAERRVESSQVDIKQLLSTLRETEPEKSQKADLNIEDSGFRYTAPDQSEKTARPFEFVDLSVIGSLFGTYILMSDEDNFYMLDQHAAHERVFFEKLLNQFDLSEKFSQQLLAPIVLNLPYGAKEAAGENLIKLREAGFEIDEFGPKAYVIKAIPAFMDMPSAERFLNYFLENVSDENVPVDRARLEKIMSAACKSAVKGGDYLKNEEITELIRELSLCKNPYSCPHGRPTFIRLSQYQIEKMFKRIQ